MSSLHILTIYSRMSRTVRCPLSSLNFFLSLTDGSPQNHKPLLSNTTDTMPPLIDLGKVIQAALPKNPIFDYITDCIPAVVLDDLDAIAAVLIVICVLTLLTLFVMENMELRHKNAFSSHALAEEEKGMAVEEKDDWKAPTPEGMFQDEESFSGALSPETTSPPEGVSWEEYVPGRK